MSNDIEKKILTAPVPGMSFAASEKKVFPWENPVVYTKINEVLKFHLSKLNEDDAIESTIKLAQLGFPLMALTNAILTDAVSDGIHTIDSSEAVRPAIFKHLMTTAEAAGIDFVTGYEEDNNLKNQSDACYYNHLIYLMTYLTWMSMTMKIIYLLTLLIIYLKVTLTLIK